MADKGHPVDRLNDLVCKLTVVADFFAFKSGSPDCLASDTPDGLQLILWECVNEIKGIADDMDRREAAAWKK
jgi:hypothetical protein